MCTGAAADSVGGSHGLGVGEECRVDHTSFILVGMVVVGMVSAEW